MKTKELLDEYAGTYLVVNTCKNEYEGAECPICIDDKEHMQEIIKELEASIRKEVVEEIWKVIKDTDGSVGLRSVEIIKEIKEYALLKGITLQ